MIEKLVKYKKYDFEKAKECISKSLNDKKNYYLNIKTDRYSMNVIIKEHLNILEEYINYMNNYN